MKVTCDKVLAGTAAVMLVWGLITLSLPYIGYGIGVAVLAVYLKV
jgi:hypothetical protein